MVVSIKDFWLWTIVEPAIAVICACLPMLGTPIRGMFRKIMALRSTKKPDELKDLNIASIGGRPTKLPPRAHLPRGPGNNGQGSFERLSDVENVGGIPSGLWPQGYRTDRETTVVGTDSHSAVSDEIASNTIHVRNEVHLTETTV